jgi:hypothetical protein
VKSPTFVLAAFTKQKFAHAFDAELVELVDGAQHGQASDDRFIGHKPIASITPSSTFRLFTRIT